MRLGIDVGSTTVKTVVLDDQYNVVHTEYRRHYSKVADTLADMLARIRELFPDMDGADVALSGSAGLGLAERAGLPFVQEVHATRLAAERFTPGVDVVIELGGEDAKLLFLSGLYDARMNGSCAGGTGAFIDQMATLLKISVGELNERAKSENPPIAFTFPRDATIDDTHIAQARWGSAITLAYLDALGVRRFFENRAGHVGFPAHAGRIFEMLASERMIHVAPKRETWQRRASFPRTCDFTLADTYAAFQCFARNERALVAHLSKTYQAIREPYQVNSVLLVLASFTLADTGDVNATNARPAGGIDRDEGLSMGIGMLLDRTGIPMTYHVTSASPSAEEVSGLVASAKSNFGAKRVIVVAGRTPHAREIVETLAESGDGFVFFRPLETAAFDLQAWVADASDYITTQSGSYKVKSRTDEMAGIRVKDTVLWGRDYAKIARKQGRAEDEARDLALDGYICISSSETKLTAGTLFHIYRELWRLTEPFQLLESDFSPSPYPVAHAIHMRAHFLVCYAAFFALRLLRSDMGWSRNAAQVADALLRMEGSHLAENWFLFSYRSPITDEIERAAGVDVARRLRTAADIKRDIAKARKHIERQEG